MGHLSRSIHQASVSVGLCCLAQFASLQVYVCGGPNVCSGPTGSVTALLAVTAANLLPWVSTKSPLWYSRQWISAKTARKTGIFSLFLIFFSAEASRPCSWYQAPGTCAVTKAQWPLAQMLTIQLFPHFSAWVKAISSAFWADVL